MAYATYKTVAVSSPQRSLTPCVFDDDPAERDLLAHLITDMGYEPVSTPDAEEALRLIRMGRCRVVFASTHLDNPVPFDFLDRALRCDPGVQVMIMPAQYTLEAALEAIRHGAADFLPKPLDQVRLKRTLDDLAALYDQRRRVRSLEEQLLKDLEFHGIVGKSPAMLEVFDFTRNVARHYTNVLLVGPTGSGKELVARAIHLISPVGNQRLAMGNVSAMVDTLLDDHLFGRWDPIGWRCATVRRWWTRCWRASCSGTCAARSPGPRTPGRDCSSMPTAARCFWTKWGRLPWSCRRNCFA